MKTMMTFALATALACAQQYTPKIPKVWDEAMVASMELPLAPPAPRPVHVPAGWYYSIPVVTIYKSYPLTMPGKDIAEYQKWLEQQEPEIAFDAAKLKTEADWIAAGKLVFDTSLDRRPAPSPLPPGPFPPFAPARYWVREKGKIERVLGCRECHPPQARSPAAPARTGRVPPPFGDLEARSRFATPWFDPDPNLPPFVSDPRARWGSEGQFPIQVPDLIGIKERKYLDHTGLHLHRSIGDLMRYAALASNHGMERYRRYGDFIPAGVDFRELPASSTLLRFSDEQLYALALYIYSLQPPPNPNQPDAMSAAGKKVFESQGCQGCHPPPQYTNNKLIPADGFIVPPEHRKTYDILDVRIGLDPVLAMKTRRATGYYKVPSLKGVWYRPTLEHRGSVASLEDWFDPQRLRDDYVVTGTRGRTPTRAVKGHQFGLKLNAEDMKALIAFLKTL